MAKKLGRSELLNWINSITQSDYPKIENLSDGVGYCQIMDAFFNNCGNEIMKLKLNSKEVEDYQKNFNLLNIMLGKQKSFKQVDPIKMTKFNFSSNFEFLQFLYDFINKVNSSNNNNNNNGKNYKGLKRRIEILKNQFGNRFNKNKIKNFLPSHLMTNDLILKMENNEVLDTENIEEDENNNNDDNNNNNNNDENNNIDNNNEIIDKELEKFKNFFNLLEEDLNNNIESNQKLHEEIKDAEGERLYYLNKLQTILNKCENKKNKTNNEKVKNICNKIIDIITHVPDDFVNKD